MPAESDGGGTWGDCDHAFGHCCDRFNARVCQHVARLATAEAERIRAENAFATAEAERQHADDQRKRAEVALETAEAERKRAEKALAGETAAHREAEKEKSRAESASASETVAQREAKTEKARAEEQRLRTEWSLYVGNINSAQREWEIGNVRAARNNLDSCRPDFRGWEYNYLFTLFNRNQLTLKGHTGPVNSVAFSPDGQRIVSGGGTCIPGGSFFEPGELKVWDAATGQETLTLKVNINAVTSVAFSPDGEQIAFCTSDGIKVWDTTRGQKTFTFKGHTGGVDRVAFSPDGKRIASDGHDNTIKVWDAATGQETLTLKGHTQPVNSVAFSPDGRRIVSGGGSRTRMNEPEQGVGRGDGPGNAHA